MAVSSSIFVWEIEMGLDAKPIYLKSFESILGLNPSLYLLCQYSNLCTLILRHFKNTPFANYFCASVQPSQTSDLLISSFFDKDQTNLGLKQYVFRQGLF